MPRQSRPPRCSSSNGFPPASERHAPIDAAQVRALLEDVVSVSDGAGMVARAARRPVVGRDKVARFVAGFAAFFWTDTTLVWLTTNGAPSVLISQGDEPVAVLSIDSSSDGIERLRWVMVPDKLARLPR